MATSYSSKEQATYKTVLVLAMARLFTNMTRRFYYPFLPEISRNLGVSLAQVQGAAASQAGIGLVSPLFGGLSERYGRKRVMLGAMGLLSGACIPGVLAPDSFGVFYAVMVAWGFAKWLFDPAMQAYIAERVPYMRRGWAIGMTELAWAGALLISAPIAGVLLGINGLFWVYGMLFLCTSSGFMLIFLFIEPDHPTGAVTSAVNAGEMFKLLWASSTALAALSFSVTLYTANEMLFIVYGEWMETTFDLELATLGIVTVIIAVSEVMGESFVVTLSDRLGKRRVALVATFLSSLGYVLLPHLAFSLVTVMLGLFAIFVCIEIAIVSSIPLFTEVLPNARAVMMSSNVAAQGGGRFVGAFLGGAIYSASGFALTGLVAGVIGLVAFGIMQGLIAER